jgi:hypothetical protein
MICDAAETQPMDPSEVRARYEVLRLAALGEPLPPEARSGLMLFLHRGMWAWARTPLTSVSQEPSQASSLASTALGAREEVIRVGACGAHRASPTTMPAAESPRVVTHVRPRDARGITCSTPLYITRFEARMGPSAMTEDVELVPDPEPLSFEVRMHR